MFDKIVESVLNEISAEDAYNKFYSNLPKEEFFELVSLYGKFDNIMKALVNSINSEKGTFEDAKKFIKIYKEAPNNVRMKFLQNFKKGDYADIDDMINGVYDVEKNGADTLKTIQNLGLITLLDNENYRLTCTTTYEANHHFYGNSSWCTASDRFGRYDGWKYFLQYIFDVSFGDIEDDYDELEPINICAVLLQLTDKANNQIYQIQMYGNLEAGQICDFKDNSRDINIPDDVYQLIKPNMSDLFKATREAFPREYEYQRGKDDYVNKKRERIIREIDELQDQLQSEASEFARQKMNFINGKVSNMLNGNLLENPEFVKNMIRSELNNFNDDNTYTKEELLKYEEILKKQGYLVVDSIVDLGTEYVGLKLTPSFGLIKDVDTWTPNGYPVLKDIFCIDNWFDACDLRKQNAVIIAKVYRSKEPDELHITYDDKMEVLEILSVLKNDGTGEFDLSTIIDRNRLYYNEESEHDYRNDFLVIRQYKFDDISGYVSDTEITLFSPEKRASVKLSGNGYSNICYKNMAIFYDPNSPEPQKAELVDLRTMKCSEFYVKEITGSFRATNMRGYWLIGSRNRDKKGFLFCNDIVPLNHKIENMDTCFANCVETPSCDIAISYSFRENLSSPKITHHGYNTDTKTFIS